MKLVETDGAAPVDWVKRIDETIKRIIETCQEPSLNASWVADEVMREIDPDKASVPAISETAHAYVKDRAAALLRKMFEPEHAPRGSSETRRGIKGMGGPKTMKHASPREMGDYILINNPDLGTFLVPKHAEYN